MYRVFFFLAKHDEVGSHVPAAAVAVVGYSTPGHAGPKGQPASSWLLWFWSVVCFDSLKRPFDNFSGRESCQGLNVDSSEQQIS